jgi:hypothetical protein
MVNGMKPSMSSFVPTRRRCRHSESGTSDRARSGPFMGEGSQEPHSYSTHPPRCGGNGLRPSRYATWPAAESARRSRWRRARADGVPGSAVMNTTC